MRLRLLLSQKIFSKLRPHRSHGFKTSGRMMFFFILLHTLSACTLYSPGSSTTAVLKDCNVPGDQTGTMAGHWPVLPIPIAFHQGDFDPNETSAMVAAADTWNKFYTASMNIQTLDYGDSASPKTSPINNPAQGGSVCAQGIMQGNSYLGNVAIFKDGRWPNNYGPSVMALTTICHIPAKPYPTYYMAIMEINYQSFFVQGTRIPDLQTIVLHELGHLHGLGHSCEVVSKPNVPNCADPNLNPDYFAALMYYSFGFNPDNTGEQKRDLRSNDQSRANCLYSGATPGASPTPQK
jgi:hypothetical protein